MAKRNLNTTENVPQNMRGMSDAEIDREIERMGAELASQEKERIRIPLDPLADPKNQVQMVGVNGHRFNIKRGEAVDVPKCVAEVLRTSGLI